jgi:uncharacterized protein
MGMILSTSGYSKLRWQEKLQSNLRLPKGHTARMAAGLCWPWSAPRLNGSLVNDILIPGHERLWNAKSDAGRLARHIPKESVSAHDPDGINQVGCVTPRGVLSLTTWVSFFGTDLVFDPKDACWMGLPERSFDTVVKRLRETFIDANTEAFSESNGALRVRHRQSRVSQ